MEAQSNIVKIQIAFQRTIQKFRTKKVWRSRKVGKPRPPVWGKTLKKSLYTFVDIE